MGYLSITTTPALIGIKTTSAKQEIQQPKAEVKLNIQHPKVEIDSEQVQVRIDQYQCFAESGLKNYLDLTKDNAAFAQQKFSEAVARIVRQGDEMVENLHKGRDMIPIHAMENAIAKNSRQFNMVTMPKSCPKIDFVGGTVDINVVEGKVDIQVKTNKPIIDYNRGNVDIYLRQKNSIDIEYVDGKVDEIG